MNIKVSKELAERIGLKALVPFGIGLDRWTWQKSNTIDLSDLSAKDREKLKSLFTALGGSPAAGIILNDFRRFEMALAGDVAKVKARTVEQFTELLIKLIATSPGHRIYRITPEGQRFAYYVDQITYSPPETRSGYTSPATCDVVLFHEEFGDKNCVTNLEFRESHCRGLPVGEALAAKDYVIETDELREEYLAHVETYKNTVDKIGKQYRCSGFASDKDMDGNTSAREDSWYWRRTNTYPMHRNGEASRVLIDVFVETEKEEDRRRAHEPNRWWWKNRRGKAEKEMDDEDETALRPEDETEEAPTIEIPIHPMVAIFDLKRQLRLRVHVSALTEYVYDPDITKKLILPEATHGLISVLLQHKTDGFRDVVAGKSGGAIVLLSGPPGVGKTLTAEVYAESEGRALYTIQCSQLGTDPETLEDELLKVFSRARRWNAILLLDEADVYVQSRGSDLVQNAIVGVFLRVLEYQSTVLFLTTNRPENVDDAIASRCIARVDYEVPPLADQIRIWKVLSSGSGMNISDETIEKVATENPHLSGRDIKQLLKLASMLTGQLEPVPGSKRRRLNCRPITTDDINFVKRFRPSGEESKKG